jgi:hypothetical protein
MKKIMLLNINPVCKYIFVVTTSLLVTTLPASANRFHFKKFESSPIEGRWDITIHTPEKELPSWLEVRHSGLHTLVGQFVGSSGSARPISKVNFSDGKISFSIPPQWEPQSNDLSVEGTLAGDSLTGNLVTPDGKNYSWTGVRAPSLRRQSEPVWGQPIHLFNGTDLSGWHATGDNQWIAANGVLRSPKSGSNLVSDKTFTDFKLHIEFRYPK